MLRAFLARTGPLRTLARAPLHASATGREQITPWYVAEAQKLEQEQAFQRKQDLPPLPANPPPELKGIVTQMVDEMGLQDVVVIDKRESVPVSGAFGPAICVLGTGASPRHLGAAGAILLTYLKKQHSVYAHQDGVLTTNFVKLHARRQRRRQQRQRSFAGSPSLDRVGSWVAIDTKVNNIYVHIMTAERREEVDLENLEQGEDSLQPGPESLTASSAQYHDPAGTYTTASGVTASGVTASGAAGAGNRTGKRDFHTCARRRTIIPSTREELALENLDSERRSDLTLNSFEVQDFVKNFPELPTRDDWKLRLRFFALCAINSAAFPVARVVDEAEEQQISGFALDDEDVELVMASLCYHGQQGHFSELVRDDEATAAWRDLCDLKAQLVMRLFAFAFEPANRSLLTNNRLLTLLYRMFTCPTAESTTPAAAMQFDSDISSSSGSSSGSSSDSSGDTSVPLGGLDAFYDLARLTPVRYLLECTTELQNIQTVGMLLSSLANARQYSPFWKVAEGALLHARDPEYVAQFAELVVGLAVRSGAAKEIDYAISTYLPQKILMNGVKLTPNLVAAVRSGLNVIDRNALGYKSVRRALKLQ